MSSEIVVEPRNAGRRRFSVSSLLDGFFFVFAALAAVWLATIVFGEGFQWRWSSLLYFIVFWALLAYLVLPRLHRILTTIYVPDYFIGRARTSDGLLGDPVNLALLGTEEEVHAAMAAAGWIRADDVTAGSSLRIVASTVTRRSYDEAPVSPLFLFGRQQDFAYQQEVAGNPAKRHHVRFWRCPDDWLLPGGRRVEWLAAGTFDRAVGLSLFTLQVTHKIDADTDIERDHIIATIRGAVPDAGLDVIRDFSTGYHSRNGGGDSITTDGDMPIVDLRSDAERTDAASPRAVTRDAATPDASASASAASAAAALARPGDKRSAFESSFDLARPVTTSAGARRPSTITMGVVLIVLRVIGGSAWLLQLATEWDSIVNDLRVDVEGVDPSDVPGLEQVALWVIVGIGILVFIVELSVVILIYRGVNWARMLVLVIATFGIIVAAVDVAAGGEGITLRTTLITLSLDILILLALSSRSARAYSRRGGGR